MVKLKAIPQTATFAWSPLPHDPLLVTGTVAGAIDADFSSTTQLELWDLSLIDRSSEGFQLKPKVSTNTDARFYDIAWGGVSSSRPSGVIAAALENGHLQLWDPDQIVKNQLAAPKDSSQRHSGAIKSLQFNPIQHHLLASGGSKGEVFVWDVDKFATPFAPGTTPSSRLDEVETVAWNNSVAHILATGGNAGFASIWDLKNRREVLHLHYSGVGGGRKAVSSIAWHPDNSTKLLTASEDDASPVILLWDLRNANAPERVLEGHEKGVLSLDWCKQDSGLLLSSGKDNRTLLWNPETGEKIGEYPIATNWCFQTKFNPVLPDIFASASFDGKVTVQTLQDVGQNVKQAALSAAGDDFWNTASYVDTLHPTFVKSQPPKWLKRPVSATFGFGGKLVTVSTGNGASTVKITKFSGDQGLTEETSKFAAALQEDNVKKVVKERLESTSDSFDWQVLSALLGAGDNKAKLSKFYCHAEQEEEKEKKEGEKPTTTESSVFGDDDQDFLDSLKISEKYIPPQEPFNLFGSISDYEKKLNRAIINGDFDAAVNLALKEKNLADAFALTFKGSDDVKTKVQNAYMTQHNTKSFVRLLAAVTDEANLDDLVENTDITEWKDVLSCLFTYAKGAKFEELITKLGNKLQRAHENDLSSSEFRNSALLCYIAGANLEKAAAIWHSEVAQHEQEFIKDTANGVTPYAAHVKALHSFIEKVTIFRKAVAKSDFGGNLDQLYDAYRDYANIVASQGHLELAEKYLDLLPAQYPGAWLEKERVMRTTHKAPVKPTAASRYATSPAKGHLATASYGANSIYAPVNPAAAPSVPNATGPRPGGPTAGLPPMPQTQIPQNSIAAPMPAQIPMAPNPYAPATQAPVNPYQPQVAAVSPVPAPAPLGPPPTAGGVKAGNSPPLPPPPPASGAKKSSASGWNDLPASALVNASKSRPGSTPQAIVSPFPNAPGVPPYGRPRSNNATAPPLPGSRGPASAAAAPPPPQGPPKTAPVNPYAAVAAVQSPGPVSGGPGVLPGGVSYGVPPSGPGAYGGAPGMPPNVGSSPQGYFQSSVASPPAINPYAPNVPSPGASLPVPSPYAPVQSPGAVSGAPVRPLAATAVDSAAASTQEVTPHPAPEQVAPPSPKHPPGDRSHIPAEARSIFEILSAEINRVEPVIPATYHRQVADAKKRLNILFDHLNNEDLLSSETVADMSQLVNALAQRDYDTALQIHLDILTSRSGECGQWMVGVKRLIEMSRAVQ